VSGPYRIQAVTSSPDMSARNVVVKEGDRTLFDHRKFCRDDAARIRDELNRASGRMHRSAE
jgi:hypothetical protein